MTKEKELKLTIKQEAFARAYVETGNASPSSELGVTFYDLPEE